MNGCNAKLLVLVPVQVSVQFAMDGPKFLGDYVQITCIAQGDLPKNSSFQWTVQGHDTVSGTKGIQISRFGQSSILVIPELDVTHSGTYTCIITNQNGGNVSKSVELVVQGMRKQVHFLSYKCIIFSVAATILISYLFYPLENLQLICALCICDFIDSIELVPPRIANFNFDGPKEPGDVAQIACHVTHGDTPLQSLTWTFQGHEDALDKIQGVQIAKFGPTTSILTIPSVDMHHSGVWR